MNGLFGEISQGKHFSDRSHSQIKGSSCRGIFNEAT